MKISIRIDQQSCIRCGHCVQVCPAQIFVQESEKADVSLCKPGNCIICGHCVSVCPTDSITHARFPDQRIHRIDYKAMPSPEQVELLMAARRSNRAISDKPIPQEWLDRIIAAADRAPTATNARELGYTLITDPVMLHRITEFTFGVFGKLVKRLTHPLVKPWLKRLKPDIYGYIPAFKNMEREYRQHGTNRILRGATALLFIHAPKSNRFGVEDANLAYQNASLMAESLGVSQVYMGFIMTADKQDKKGELGRMVGIDTDRRICAIIALGMPKFRFRNYIDREKATVTKI